MLRVSRKRYMPPIRTALILLAAAILPQLALADFIQQGPKLVGNGAVGSAHQGVSVAVSADGNTAIVGGSYDAQNVGAAWVFVRSNGAWTQQGGKLVGTGAVGAARQGSAVAISADGNTAIVAGGWDDGYAGAVWVFVRSNGVWAQQGNKLVGIGAVGYAVQGSFSVAISADGNTALIGGAGDDSETGAAWVFTRSGENWTQQGSKLVGTGSIDAAQQGRSVALSADGNTALIGGPSDSYSIADNVHIGAAWIFSRSAGTWSQIGNKLVGTDASGVAGQGRGVALSADGRTAVSGGSGAAWVFTFNGASWTQQGGKLAAGTGKSGESVSLSGDGDTLLSGGAVAADGVSATWVFSRSGGVWAQYGNKLVGSSEYGNTINTYPTLSLSTDGSTAIISSRYSSAPFGEAWVWVRRPPHDFSGDTDSDILWRNPGGDMQMWLMNGGSATTNASIGNVGTNWSVVAQRDFNNDGKSDILWRDTAGNIAMWLMNGVSASSVANLGNVGTNWSVISTADFNGDGKGDILWRDTSGNVALWLMNGTSASQVAGLGKVGTDWTLAATADFNADGKSDILWRNTTGDIVMWLMNGTTASSVVGLGTIPTNWSVVGTADFNGDGKGDILWRNTVGDITMWLMNGVSISSVANLGNVSTNWSVASNGDYNGDGKGDIVWRNTAGDIVIWVMKGTAVSQVAGLGSVPPAWSIQNANAN